VPLWGNCAQAVAIADKRIAKTNIIRASVINFLPFYDIGYFDYELFPANVSITAFFCLDVFQIKNLPVNLLEGFLFERYGKF
jgi:hypothetical protein